MSYQERSSSQGLPPSTSLAQSYAQQPSSSQPERPSSTIQPGPNLRASDSLRRELPPLQPVTTRSTGPLGGVSSILNPSATLPAANYSVGQADITQRTSPNISASSQNERTSSIIPSYETQQSLYPALTTPRPALFASTSYGTQAGAQWYPPSETASSAAKHSVSSPGQTAQTYAPGRAQSYSAYPQRAGGPMGYVAPAPQWPTTTQRRGSSVAPRETPFDTSSLSRNPDQPVMMTLQTDDGPVAVPLNMQSASRAADEKRKRNAGASARFRQRRKEKEQASTHAIDALKQRIDHLEEDVAHLRSERDYFARIVLNSADGNRHFPRPQSPRLFRRPALPLEMSRTSSPASTTSYQEHGIRDTEGRYGRRRLTQESHTMSPRTGQSQQSQIHYGYSSAASTQTGYGQQPSYPSSTFPGFAPPQSHPHLQQQQQQQTHQPPYQAYPPLYPPNETRTAQDTSSAQVTNTPAATHTYPQQQWSQSGRPPQQ